MSPSVLPAPEILQGNASLRVTTSLTSSTCAAPPIRLTKCTQPRVALLTTLTSFLSQRLYCVTTRSCSTHAPQSRGRTAAVAFRGLSKAGLLHSGPAKNGTAAAHRTADLGDHRLSCHRR